MLNGEEKKLLSISSTADVVYHFKLIKKTINS